MRPSGSSVVAWGDNSDGQINVPILPAGLSYVEIAAGERHTLARFGDKEGSWTDLSNGLAGTHGPPLLTDAGTLIGEDPFTIPLTNALEHTGAVFISGISAANVPLKGGVLVPNPFIIKFGVPTGGNGNINLSTAWPTDLPSGFEVFTQFWIPDPAAPAGYASSNGLRATMP